MKIEELKKVIKPLIKECIKEVLLEEGLSKIIAEAKSQSATLPVDNKVETRFEQMQVQAKKQAAKILGNAPQQKLPIQEAKKKMLDAISNNGFDAFAGTEPLREQAEIKGADPGIDISGLIGNKAAWQQRLEAMSKKNNK